MTPNLLNGIVVVIIAVVSALAGYAFAEVRHDKKASQLQKSLNRQARRRRDTEMNIGNRFAKIVRELCSKDRFWIKFQHLDGNGYFITIWPREGNNSLFNLMVNLDCVDGTQISYTLGEKGHFRHPIDELSIQAALRQVEGYLKTL